MSKTKKITTTSGTYMLCKSILGASITNVPGVFTELGLAFGTAVFAFIAFISVYSLLWLTIVAKETQANSLVDIGEKIDKKNGKMFVTLTLFLMCMIPLIFYIIKSTLYVESFLEHFGAKVDKEYVRIGVGVVCMIMSISFKNADKLKYASIIGLISLSFMTLYTVYLFVTNFANLKFGNQKMFCLNSKSIERISVACFAFCSQFSIISITNNIDSLKDCKTIIVSSNAISLIVYLVTGICGHFAQTMVDTDDFFKSVSKNMFTEILKLTLAIVNICTFPLIMLATREAFDFFVPGNKKGKSRSMVENYEAAFLTAAAYTISILFDSYQALLATAFFFAGSIVMFALPSYFYYRVMKRKMTMFAYVVLTLNVLLTLFGFFAGVYILF